jgi:hypothetical protein
VLPGQARPVVGDAIQIVYLRENPRFCGIASNWLDAEDESEH